MEGKISFILYKSIIYTVEKLDDKRAGQLFKLILRYVNDKDPKPPNKILEIAFEPIKQDLKKDLQSWLTICQKNAEAGKLSAAARAKKKAAADKLRAEKNKTNGR